jgi:hypothetical protein
MEKIQSSHIFKVTGHQSNVKNNGRNELQPDCDEMLVTCAQRLVDVEQSKYFDDGVFSNHQNHDSWQEQIPGQRQS